MRAALICIFVAATLPLSAQKITPTEAMVAKTVLRYRGLKTLSHRMKGSMKFKVNGVGFSIDFQTICQAGKDNRFRVSSTVKFLGEESTGVTVSDGQTLWDHDPAAGSYTERPLSELKPAAARGPNDWLMDRAGVDFALMFFLNMEGSGPFAVRPGAEKSIQVAKFPTKKVDGTTMYLIPVPVPAGGAGAPKNAVLYVDAKQMMIRRARFSVTTPAEPGRKPLNVDFVTFYSEVKPDEPIPDETFTFTPPESVTKVEKLEPVFKRAFDR